MGNLRGFCWHPPIHHGSHFLFLMLDNIILFKKVSSPAKFQKKFLRSTLVLMKKILVKRLDWSDQFLSMEEKSKILSWGFQILAFQENTFQGPGWSQCGPWSLLAHFRLLKGPFSRIFYKI